MNKSDQKKTKPLDILTKRIIEAHEMYDDPSPVIHDPVSNTFKTENQLKKEFKEQENKKLKKSKPFNKHRATKQTNPRPQIPLKIDFDFQIPKKVIPKTDQTLANLEKERTKIDPDYFKGLGTFLPKKI
jgi:hypothetical protein